MEHVKRVVLVPEHVADNTTQRKPLIPPLTAQVNYLDSEMDSLLRQDLIHDEKANMYYQILQRYLTYYDKRMSQPVDNRDFVGWNEKVSKTIPSLYSCPMKTCQIQFGIVHTGYICMPHI